MAEIVNETVITSDETPSAVTTEPTQSKANGSQTMSSVILFFFGILEVLLVFRFVLKAMGANVSSFFVNLIYDLTGIFILPFEGIFRRAVTEGIETTAVIEPATIVAIIVYALLAWGIVKLVQISSGEK